MKLTLPFVKDFEVMIDENVNWNGKDMNVKVIRLHPGEVFGLNKEQYIPYSFSFRSRFCLRYLCYAGCFFPAYLLGKLRVGRLRRFWKRPAHLLRSLYRRRTVRCSGVCSAGTYRNNRPQKSFRSLDNLHRFGGFRSYCVSGSFRKIRYR